MNGLEQNRPWMRKHIMQDNVLCRVVSVSGIYDIGFLVLFLPLDEARIQRVHHEGNAVVSHQPGGGHGIHGLF